MRTYCRIMSSYLLCFCAEKLISHLSRGKLIHTVSGFGYKLEENHETTTRQATSAELFVAVIMTLSLVFSVIIYVVTSTQQPRIAA